MYGREGQIYTEQHLHRYFPLKEVGVGASPLTHGIHKLTSFQSTAWKGGLRREELYTGKT